MKSKLMDSDITSAAVASQAPLTLDMLLHQGDAQQIIDYFSPSPKSLTLKSNTQATC